MFIVTEYAALIGMLIMILECVYAATSSVGEEEGVGKICIKGKKIIS